MRKFFGALFIIMLLFAACGGEEDGAAEAAQQAQGSLEPTATPTLQPTPTPQPARILLSVIDPLSDRGIAGAELSFKDEQGGTLSSVSTNEVGAAQTELVSGAGYSLSASADGFHSRAYIFDAKPGDNELRVILVPVSIGNDAYVLLEWDGPQDLDICAFNPRKREYVFFGNPEDFEGDYLIADNDAQQGYELLCLRNVLAERAKTVYVADLAAAAAGGPSDMEKDGVRVSAWDNLGLVYVCGIDAGQKGAIWEPFYFFGGRANTDQEKYVSDYADYTWLTGAADQKGGA